jgi:hypothetical protein
MDGVSVSTSTSFYSSERLSVNAMRKRLPAPYTEENGDTFKPAAEEIVRINDLPFLYFILPSRSLVMKTADKILTIIFSKIKL